MSADTPVKDQDKFVLRLPDGMRDRLKAEAEANKRSMNAEIVARLEASLHNQDEIVKNFNVIKHEAVSSGVDPARRDMMAIAMSLVEISDNIKTIKYNQDVILGKTQKRPD